MKNGMKTLVVTLLLISFLTFGGVLTYFLFLYSPSQTIIETGTYTCPPNLYCTIVPILECETPSQEPNIILRWSQNIFKPPEIAVDRDSDGDLDRMVLTGEQIGSSIPLFIRFPDPISVSYVAKSGSTIAVCSPTIGGSINCRVYNEGGSIPTSSLPTEPYSSSGRELIDGTVPIYSCSKNLYVGSTQVGTLSHEGMQPTPSGGKSGSTYQITSNQVFNTQGTGQISLDITTSPIPVTTCTASDGTVLQMGEGVCINQYTLESCENVGGQPSLVTQTAIPPQICRDGEIVQAYSVTVTLNKPVISLTEPLIVDFNLQGTPDNKNIPITATISKNSQYITSKIQLTGSSYLTAGKTTFSFSDLTIGNYVLEISFSHPDGDYIVEYNFQVTEDLALVLTTANPIQFDSSPIVASLNSFRGGSPKTLTNFELEAKFNNNNVYTYTTSNPSLGVLTFTFPLSGDGILRLRARGNDESGLWTDWTNWFEVTVRKSTILISTDFKTDQCTGSITQSFETKDSTGNLVDTQNQVQINKPLGGTDTASVSGSGGKYSFTYNYAEGGIYTIRITSINSQLGSSQLNQGQGQIINILGGDSCTNPDECEGISCYTTYIIIGVGILSLVAFVYFVFFFRRKR